MRPDAVTANPAQPMLARKVRVNEVAKTGANLHRPADRIHQSSTEADAMHLRQSE